jgi:hypothetical protein
MRRHAISYDWSAFHAELKHTVLDQLDCVELLHQRGRPSTKRSKPGTCWAHCPAPDHPDNNPSCLVHADRFYCFACGAKGDVFELLAMVCELPHGASFGDKVRAGLEVLGIDFEQEKARFIEIQRRHHKSPSPSSPEDAPASDYRAPVVSLEARRPTPPPQELAPTATSVAMWQHMLDGLVLESQEARYLEHERGLPAMLCRSVGMVSCSREQWTAGLRPLLERYSIEACLESGLFSARRDAPKALTPEDLRGHPYAERMILMPYGHDGKLEGLRCRQTGACLDHNGARYLALLGRQNVVRAPYLAHAQGGALLPPCGHRGVLYVCEGELDALSLVSLGRAAIGIPGARAWRAAWGANWRHQVQHVVLWADDDEAHKVASTRWLAHIARDLAQMHGEAWVSESVRITSAMAHPECKDANDMLVAGLLEAHLEQFELQLGVS